MEEDIYFLKIQSSLSKDIKGHRWAQLAEKSRVSLSESSELGSKAQLSVMTSPAVPVPAGRPHWAAHLAAGLCSFNVPCGQQSVPYSVLFLHKGSSVFCSICSIIQSFLFLGPGLYYILIFRDVIDTMTGENKRRLQSFLLRSKSCDRIAW